MLVEQATKTVGCSVFVYRGHKIDDELRHALEGGVRPMVINFSQDIFVHEYFGPGTSIENYDRYLPVHELRELIARSYELGRDWYRMLPEDCNLYDGVSLGAVAEYDFVIVFIEVLKGIRLAERIIAMHAPARIILVDDGSVTFRAFQAVCRSRGVELVGIASQKSHRRLLLEQPRLLTWRKLAVAKCFVLLYRLLSALRSKPQSMARVLMPEYFRFGPLVKGLASDPRFEFCIIGGNYKNVVGALTDGGRVRYISPVGYMRWSQFSSVQHYERRLQDCLDSLQPLLGEQGPCYRGYPLYEVCRDIIEEHLRNRFVNYAAFIEISRAVLVREKITHVILNQDLQGYHKVLGLVANALGVHTICFQHGLSADVPNYGKHISRTIAVWGEREREVYVRRGRVSDDRIQVVGDPFIRNLPARQFDREAICRRLGLDPLRPIVLMSCERFVNLFCDYERETSANDKLAQVCQVLADDPTLQLLVRFKASFAYAEFGDSIETKEKIINRYNRGNIFLDTRGDIYERLFIADVVVVTNSTIGLEAMIFGKPVLMFTLPGAEDLVEYVSEGAAVRVTNREEMRLALNRILADPIFPLRLQEIRRRYVDFNVVNLHDPDPVARIRQLLTQERRNLAATV